MYIYSSKNPVQWNLSKQDSPSGPDNMLFWKELR